MKKKIFMIIIFVVIASGILIFILNKRKKQNHKKDEDKDEYKIRPFTENKYGEIGKMIEEVSKALKNIKKKKEYSDPPPNTEILTEHWGDEVQINKKIDWI